MYRSQTVLLGASFQGVRSYAGISSILGGLATRGAHPGCWSWSIADPIGLVNVQSASRLTTSARINGSI
jgi:hypothetical protein